MARPNCPEDICNLSLDYLKQSPIKSITTPVTNTEFIFARWYDIKRQAGLRAHTWKFAIKRTILNPNTSTPPPFGYLYAYDLPSDYIRKVTIGNDYHGNLKQEIEIENGQILAEGGEDAVSDTGNGDSLYLRYIYDCTSVAKMDPLFISFFSLGMAIELSAKFSVAATAVDRLMKTFETIDCEARTVNGQDNPPKRIQQSKRLAKRRGYQTSIFAGDYTVFGQ